ncbi:MAG: glycosyltransferase family 2 protein [Bacteroidales bacterium]|nr:glycosyltransferase family 2 protein [Bacteroidales bacterium]
MILFYIVLPIVFFAFVRFLVALFNYLTQPYLKEYPLKSTCSVSVLVPARNEESNIWNLLTDLQSQTYGSIEVVVYNDSSTDATGSIVEEFVKVDNRFKLINGQALPHGWLGKNNACHQLAMQAKGDYLLFLDADVRVQKDFVEKALAYMQHKKLHLLSFFPYQVLGSFGETITVPVMQWILLSLLPLKLVMWSRRSSLSAANGQMMMFRAETYRKHRFHEMFRSNPVEDILIARAVKRLGYRMATLLGLPGDIRCRMYVSGNDAIDGFSKNVCEFFGGNRNVMFAFAAITTLGPFAVLFFMPFPLIFIYFFSVLMARIMIADLSKQNVFKTVILFPLQQMSFIKMVVRWEKNRRNGTLTWKGRKIV